MGSQEAPAARHPNTSDAAADNVDSLGGPQAFRSGSWFLKLVARSLRAYEKNAKPSYFKAKYPALSNDAIAAKLISVAARNAALVGGTAGAVMTADEIATLASLGLASPISVSVAIGAVATDLIAVTRIQLMLVASLADLYGVPVHPEDPEDVLTVIGYFMASQAADAIGAGTVHVGRYMARTQTKRVFSKTTLKIVKQAASKIGIKLLQKTVVNVAVPVAAIFLGAGSNFTSTRAIGLRAKKGAKARAERIGNAGH